jgi:hypothetical protein
MALLAPARSRETELTGTTAVATVAAMILSCLQAARSSPPLLVVLLPIWRTQETIPRPAESLRELPLRPRVALPRAIRIKFVAPAVTGFGTMALVGFYAALAPSILAENLHVTSHAVAGALFFQLALVVTLIIVLTRQLASRTAMLAAHVLMPVSVALVVTAQFSAPWPS